MSKSAELRADVARLRVALEEITDDGARDAVLEMIAELERRAHELDNGSAVSTAPEYPDPVAAA
jgi:hypothetical protein